jgi:hypothetical protein
VNGLATALFGHVPRLQAFPNPALLPPGQRQSALESLSVRAAMLGRSSRCLSLYDWAPWGSGPFASTHPVHALVRQLLLERLGGWSDFDFDRAALLMDLNPAGFSLHQFNLAVRALWKSDRVGFHKGGDVAFRDGYISALMRDWDNPSVLTELSMAPQT